MWGPAGSAAGRLRPRRSGTPRGRTRPTRVQNACNSVKSICTMQDWDEAREVFTWGTRFLGALGHPQLRQIIQCDVLNNQPGKLWPMGGPPVVSKVLLEPRPGLG